MARRSNSSYNTNPNNSLMSVPTNSNTNTVNVSPNISPRSKENNSKYSSKVQSPYQQSTNIATYASNQGTRYTNEYYGYPDN
jgi:hypothetical protein